MVYVNKCSSHSWQEFNLVLQLLAEIVCATERRISGHYDVNFDKEILWGDGEFSFN